jgi:L-cysteine/cystine lyase
MERSTITAAGRLTVGLPAVTDPAAIRAQFPVLERLSYLNAGSNGPVPRAGIEAAEAALRDQATEGRAGHAFFTGLVERAEQLRAAVAGLMGCEPGELALTGSTTDGINAALSALDLGEGEEVLTSDEEHPGLLAPLAAHRERRGLRVRVAPFERLAEEVGPETRLVACSHVSWVTGQVADVPGLRSAGAPLLLDGAQGLGAMPLDVPALGCDFYAGPGQKWLCGPVGLGYLYVRGERIPDLPAPWPWFGSILDPSDPLGSGLQEGSRRFDTGLVAPEHSAWGLAAMEALFRPDPAPALERATALAARLAELLTERGFRVSSRGRSTLVSWETADPPAEVDRLREEGFAVRDLPGRGLVRASVGAWNHEEELERLVSVAT